MRDPLLAVRGEVGQQRTRPAVRRRTGPALGVEPGRLPRRASAATLPLIHRGVGAHGVAVRIGGLAQPSPQLVVVERSPRGHARSPVVQGNRVRTDSGPGRRAQRPRRVRRRTLERRRPGPAAVPGRHFSSNTSLRPSSKVTQHQPSRQPQGVHHPSRSWSWSVV